MRLNYFNTLKLIHVSQDHVRCVRDVVLQTKTLKVTTNFPFLKKILLSQLSAIKCIIVEAYQPVYETNNSNIIFTFTVGDE